MVIVQNVENDMRKFYVGTYLWNISSNCIIFMTKTSVKATIGENLKMYFG